MTMKRNSKITFTAIFCLVFNLLIVSLSLPVSAADRANTAHIDITNTVSTTGNVDAFTFRIEPVEGWTHENTSSSGNGSSLSASELPLPEGTKTGQSFKEITISGFAGNGNSSLTQSSGTITFTKPGWYMYRVKEMIPDPVQAGVKYDQSEYFVVVYTEYADEISDDVIVRNVTAWHNPHGSGKYRPDLEDISSITDNNGAPALDNNEPMIYGKTGIGESSVEVKFWNSQETGSLSVSKNVTGNLGDLHKRFVFVADISGLTPGIEYKLRNDGAEFISGAKESGDAFITDMDGKARLEFTLGDDDNFYFEGLPEGASFEVKESASDHFPSYEVTKGSSVIKSDSKKTHTALSTGTVEVSEAAAYSVEFTNDRDLAPVTGIYTTGLKVLFIALAVLFLGFAHMLKRAGE